MLLVIATTLLSSCLVLPKVDMNQPLPCPLVTRQVTLDVVQIASIESCRGDACLMQLTAGGVIFAASAVVSGSVALVGNTLHWIERLGKCARQFTPSDSPVVSAG
jgi:hypothetical protein